jgi:hypothetical protein
MRSDVPATPQSALSAEQHMLERLDEHERILTRHGLELGSLDRRLEAVERDHASVRLLATTTQALGERVGEALDSVDAIAECAVETVLRRREVEDEQDRERRRSTWKYQLSIAGGIGSLIALLFNLIHGF